MATIKRRKPTDLFITPTVTAGAYTAGDVVGGLLTFPTVLASQPGSGELREVILYDNVKQQKAMTLFLFDSAPSVIADNAAFNLSAADLRRCFAVVPIAIHKVYSTATRGFSLARALSVPVFTDTNGSIYAYLVCDVAPTYGATDDLTLGLSIIQDIE